MHLWKVHSLRGMMCVCVHACVVLRGQLKAKRAAIRWINGCYVYVFLCICEWTLLHVCVFWIKDNPISQRTQISLICTYENVIHLEKEAQRLGVCECVNVLDPPLQTACVSSWSSPRLSSGPVGNDRVNGLTLCLTGPLVSSRFLEKDWWFFLGNFLRDVHNLGQTEFGLQSFYGS